MEARSRNGFSMPDKLRSSWLDQKYIIQAHQLFMLFSSYYQSILKFCQYRLFYEFKKYLLLLLSTFIATHGN